MKYQLKYFLVILTLLFVTNKVLAQQNNIYLDGENYITLGGTVFPSRIDWTDASKERTWRHADQFPIKTYWFSHRGKSYAELVLTSGRSSFYIELGDNKKTYHFKEDYNHHRQAGAINNFEMALENKSGILQWCDVSYSAHLVLNVIQLDSLHLKLSFTGTVTPFANTDKSKLLIGKHLTPIKIEGKISLSKKNPDLAHLPDSYSGCDNTIYNEFSPDYSSGQYYTPTECEQSFYKKTFATLSKALSPAIKYLAAQDWDMSSAPKYHPLEHRWRKEINNFFRTDINSGIDYNLDVNANPAKGTYHDYLQKILSLSQHIGSMRNIDTSVINKIDRLQKEEPQKFKLHLQVFYNQPVQTNNQLDLSHAQVKKLSDDILLIEHVENTGNRTFFNDGGTYILVGKWTNPQFKDGYISCSPIFQNDAKKLSIQAYYIRLGCGPELAETLIKRLNLTELQQLTKITP